MNPEEQKRVREFWRAGGDNIESAISDLKNRIPLATVEIKNATKAGSPPVVDNAGHYKILSKLFKRMKTERSKAKKAMADIVQLINMDKNGDQPFEDHYYKLYAKLTGLNTFADSIKTMLDQILSSPTKPKIPSDMTSLRGCQIYGERFFVYYDPFMKSFRGLRDLL